LLRRSKGIVLSISWKPNNVFHFEYCY